MVKHRKWMICIFIICLIGGLSSCAEDRSVIGDDFEIPKLTDENTIEFTVDVLGEWTQLEVFGGGGRMAIEWGDGRLQKIEDPEAGLITYKYGNRRSYRVRIWAEELDYCNLGSLLLPVKDLRIGNLPKMRDLALTSFANTRKIDLSRSCPNVENVNIGNCADLEYVDVSQCDSLKSVLIGGNPKLTSLDVTDKCKLKNLNCSGNQLSSLSLKDLPQLNSLDCSYNPELSRLEFDEKMEISTLFIGHCNFQNLDFLDRLPLLLEFVCRNNQLKELELPESLWIQYLDCSNNQLTRLSISEHWLLTRVDCHSNRLDKEALNQLFEMLGTASDYPHSKSYLSYYDNPGEYTCNQEMPVRNGWTIEEKGAQ